MFGRLLDGLWWNNVSFFNTLWFKEMRVRLWCVWKKSHFCSFSCSEMQRIGEKNEHDLMPSIWMKDDKSSLVVDTWYNRPDEMNKIEQHIQEHKVGLIDLWLHMFFKYLIIWIYDYCLFLILFLLCWFWFIQENLHEIRVIFCWNCRLLAHPHSKPLHPS